MIPYLKDIVFPQEENNQCQNVNNIQFKHPIINGIPRHGGERL